MWKIGSVFQTIVRQSPVKEARIQQGTQDKSTSTRQQWQSNRRRRSDYMKFAIIFIIIIIAITLSPRLSAAFNSLTWSCFFAVFVCHSKRVAHHWKFTPLFVLLLLNEFSVRSSLVSPQVEQHRSKDCNRMRRRNERMSGRRIDTARLNRLLLGGRNFNTNNVRRWQWGRRTGNGMERKGGSASHFVNNHNCYSANLWESFNHGMCNQFVLRHCVNYAQSVGPSQHPGRNQWQP